MTPPRLSAPGLQARAPLSPTAQGLLAASMLGAHLLAGWALLQAPTVRPTTETPPLVRLEMVALAPAATPPPMPATAPAPVPPRAVRSAPAPVPTPTPVIAAAPLPAVERPAFVAPPPAPVQPPVPTPVREAEPVAVAPAPAPPTAPAPMAPTSPPTAAAAPAQAQPAAPLPPAPTPAAPRRVQLTDTDWVRPPAYAYPREAARRRETGTAVVRIHFDGRGVPRQVTLLRSSGSAAIDDEVQAKARAARAKPRLQDGVPIEFLADSEAEFTL